MDATLTSLVLVAVALAIGAMIGWLLGGRSAGGLRAERDGYVAERDLHLTNYKRAAQDLAMAIEDRQAHALELATLRATRDADARAHVAQVAALNEARDALAAQFAEVGQRLLDRAQTQFLETAGSQFKASETAAGARIAELLAPVHDRLVKYEAAVDRVEKERTTAFGNLGGVLESLRASNEGVKAEAARLSNSLRNAPKARGRWGEQQLRNVLENCGLSEYADFQMEVSVNDSEGGRLRPDCILRIPGDQILVIDVKMVFNDYQAAFEATNDDDKKRYLEAHAKATKNHVNILAGRGYQDQFDKAPDYVIMYITGEHFLNAALEVDNDLWEYAFKRRVLLATPTNLIAIARTVSAVWKQERVVEQAKQIAKLGRDLYESVSVMNKHAASLGETLRKSVSAYNAFATSLEGRVTGRARRLADMDIETGGKQLDVLEQLDVVPNQLKHAPSD